eukprot:m51a1_g3340 hypothetical protein (420) ;mRNA; r:395478-397474
MLNARSTVVELGLASLSNAGEKLAEDRPLACASCGAVLFSPADRAPEGTFPQPCFLGPVADGLLILRDDHTYGLERIAFSCKCGMHIGFVYTRPSEEGCPRYFCALPVCLRAVPVPKPCPEVQADIDDDETAESAASDATAVAQRQENGSRWSGLRAALASAVGSIVTAVVGVAAAGVLLMPAGLSPKLGHFGERELASLRQVAAYCDLPTLARLARVSRLCNEIVHEEAVWASVYEHLTQSCSWVLPRPDGVTWREHVRETVKLMKIDLDHFPKPEQWYSYGRWGFVCSDRTMVVSDAESPLLVDLVFGSNGWVNLRDRQGRIWCLWSNGTLGHESERFDELHTGSRAKAMPLDFFPTKREFVMPRGNLTVAREECGIVFTHSRGRRVVFPKDDEPLIDDHSFSWYIQNRAPAEDARR